MKIRYVPPDNGERKFGHFNFTPRPDADFTQRRRRSESERFRRRARWNTDERLNEILLLTRDDFVLDDPASGVPLTNPGFVQRLRELFATVQPASGARLWDIRSEDTARSWISKAVTAAQCDSVTFSIRSVTLRTCRDPFAMHLVQHQVPQKVIQTLMGHKDAKSTECYTRVFSLDVTRQLGVRFSMDAAEVGRLLQLRSPPCR